MNFTDAFLYINCSGTILFKNTLSFVNKSDPSPSGINSRYAAVNYEGPTYAHPGFFFLSSGAYSNVYNGTDDVALGMVLPLDLACKNVRPKTRWGKKDPDKIIL